MRWSRGVFLSVWAVLTAGQVYALATFAPAVAWALVVVLQILKGIATVPRLNDLGHPPDDALLCGVPLMNAKLFLEALRPTPSAADREERRKGWAGERLAVGLFAAGVRTLLAHPAIAVGTTAVYGIGFVAVDIGVGRLIELPPVLDDGGAVLSQAAAGITGLLGLFTLVQLVNRRRVSRRSWWPALLLVPAALVSASLLMGGSTMTDASAFLNPAGQDQIVTAVLGALGAGLLWDIFFGAAAGVVVVDLAEAVERGLRRAPGEVLERVRRRTLDVVPPHGSTLLAITVGSLIVVPAIVYALQYAFVDAIAVLRPDEPALKRSTEETRPVRRRIFKVYLLGWFTGLVLGVLAAVGVEAVLGAGDDLAARSGIAAAHVLRQLPSSVTGLSWATMIAGIGLSALPSFAAHTALVHLYLERRREAPAP